jgi:hypothetical protein
MTRKVSSYPRSCNLKAELAFPHEMKEDSQTRENKQVWEAYILTMKNEMKWQVLKQGKQIVEYLQEKRLLLFHEKVLIIAEGFYFTWFSELEGIEAPLTLWNHAYSAVSIYCYFNSTRPGNQIFSYLCEDQEALLQAFKKKYLATTAGTPLFSKKLLQHLTMLLPDNYLPGSPHCLETDDPLDTNRNRNQNDNTIAT